MHPRKQHIVDIYGKEPASLDELAEACIAVINKQIGPVLGFHWEVRYIKEISNTHECPLDGVCNWARRDPKLPLGYPGWSGRVWIRYPEKINQATGSWGQDPLRQTLTYPGTGGGGSYGGPWEAISQHRWHRYGHGHGKNHYPEINCYSWDYKIFESDWPLIEEGESTRKMLSILKDVPHNIVHKFSYDDPATAIADASFIAECNDRNKLKEKV